MISNRQCRSLRFFHWLLFICFLIFSFFSKATASTYNWPFTTPSNYTYDSSKIEVTGGVAQLKQTDNPPWWNANYRYRQQITVNTGADAVTAGYSVKITIDTAALEAAGKVRADRKDWRVVYWNGTNNVEIDRHYVGPSATWFKLQADIPSNSSDGNYYVYYNYPWETIDPPSDLNNVYLFYDDFESHTVGQPPTGYTVMVGNAVVVDVGAPWGKVLRIDSAPSGSKRIVVIKDGFSEADVSVQINCQYDNNDTTDRVIGAMARVSGTSSSDVNGYIGKLNYRAPGPPEYSGDMIAKYVNGSYSEITTLSDPISLSTTYTVRLDVVGDSLKMYRDGTLKLSATDTSITGAGAFGINGYNADAGVYSYVGYLAARKLVANEPTTSAGEEVSQYPDTSPTIRPATGQGVTYSALSSFSETLGAGNQGSVKYQISNDGTNWYYHDGTSWVFGSGVSQSNTASEVNTNIATFPTQVGTGTLYFLAYLISNGVLQVELDNVNIEYFISISGIVYTDEGTTVAGSGKTVRLLVNGASVGTDVTDAGGAYSITASINAGDAILVYIDGDTLKGTTVTVSDGTPLSGLDIYAGHVITRHDNGGSLTNADMSTAKGSYSDTDILYSVSAGTLTVSGSDTELYVPTGHTFAPGGNVISPLVKILGTVSGGSYTFSVSGDWDASSGTFIPGTSTVLFTGGSSTFTPGTSSYYNITVQKNNWADLTINGTATVTNDLYLNSGTSSNTNPEVLSGTINVAGNVTVGAYHGGGTTLININGTENQTISSSGGVLPSISINKSSGTLFLTGTLTIEGNWTYTAGTVDAGTSTVVFAGGNKTVDSGAMSFNDVTINMGTWNNLDVIGTMDVNGDLTIILVNQINTGTIAVAGDVTSTDTTYDIDGSGTILFDGTGNQTLGANGGIGELPSVSINKSTGILTIQDTIEVRGNWTYTAGTVDAGTSTVVFAGDSKTVDSGAMSFNNVTINMGTWKDLTIIGTMDVNGDFTITEVYNINNGTIAVAGDVTSTDTNYGVGGTGAITLDGSGAQIITATGEFPDGTFTINKPSGTATLASDLSLDATGQDLIITSGILDLAGFNLAINDLFSNDGTLRLQGGETLTNFTNDTNSGTVEYYGSGTYTSLAAGNEYYNLTFSGTGSWTANSAIDVNGNFIQSSGTFTAPSTNITIAGNFTHSGGTFNHNSGTVTLDGTNQTISGSTSFYNLIKSVSAADTLTFAAGSTQTITGNVTLTGATGNLLSLRSSITGTRWNLTISASATKSISYVDVKDGDASGSDLSHRPIGPANSVNSGNNIDWFAGYQPDSMIKLSSEADSDYLTDNTYEATASVQVKSQGVVSGSTATYTIKFQNDGEAVDSFLITGTGSGSGFTVQYLDETNTDRTTDVTGSGYTISNIEAETSRVWTLNVTPSGDPTPVAGGTSYDVFITATSVNDGTKTDQVKGTTSSTSANLTLVKAADKSNADPGEDITYTVTASNGSGLTDASNIVVTEPIPANTGFKVGSATFNAGTSTLSATITYSNDNGTSWIYTPTSGGCSAPTGYDYCVTDVRWTMTGTMPSGTSFSIGLVVRVK